jgi:hypothetical protein
MSGQPSSTSGKVCIVCGVDVSRKPRVKDQQGRYMCEGLCERTARERARAAAAKPASSVPAAPPVDDGYDMMADLLSESPAVNVSVCPGCGNAMPGGALVCMNCGYNARVGKAAKTTIVRKPVASQMPVPRRRSSGEFGPSFGVLALGSIAFFCGLAALGTLHVGLFGLGALVCAVGTLIGYIWSIVSAFRSDNAKMGVIGLLFVIPIVNLISLIFVFWALTSNPDKWSRALYTGAFLGYITVIVILFAKYGGAEGLERSIQP